MAKPAVLVVDDEPDLCELLSITLQRMDLSPRTANNIGDAQRLLKTEQFNLCLTDMQLPDGDGIEVCREIRSALPGVMCLMLTSFADDEALFASIMAGAAVGSSVG